MDSKTEQKFAKIYLEHYENGYSIRKAVFREKFKYLFLLTIMLLMAYVSYLLKDVLVKGLFIFIFGMFFGALVRDYGWFRRIKMNWPFSVKIINWDIVREIAGNQD